MLSSAFIRIVTTVHIVAVLSWLGLVLGETLIEIVAVRNISAAKVVAQLHLLMDRFLELPLIATVIGTGSTLLWAKGWDTQLLVKIGCAGVAIVCNLVCYRMVRHRGNSASTLTDAEIHRHARTYFLTLGIGLPFGLYALWLGLTRAGML